MSYEELGFGDDEAERREGWLRDWLIAHGRLLVIVLGVVLALVGLGIGGWHRYQRSLLPAPPPNVAFPAALGFEVVMCLEDDKCADQRKLVEQVLAGLPEVASFAFVSAEDSLADMRAQMVDDRLLPQYATGGGTIVGKLRKQDDFNGVRGRLLGLPGVEQVMRTEPGFWVGKAQVTVGLCSVGWNDPRCRAKATSVEQRNAIVAALKDLDAVDEVYLQDQAFGQRLYKDYYGQGWVYKGPDLLYVKVDDPAHAKAVGKAVMNMSGVSSVSLVKP